MISQRPLHRSAARAAQAVRLFALWLCALHVAVGLLGQMHAVAHALPIAAAAVAAHADDGHAPWQGGHAAGDHQDCQLWHHHALGAGLASAVCPPAVALPAPATAAQTAALLLRQNAMLFRARGPPVFL